MSSWARSLLCSQIAEWKLLHPERANSSARLLCASCAASLPRAADPSVHPSQAGGGPAFRVLPGILLCRWRKEPYLTLQWVFMCSFSSGDVSNSFLQALQVCTRLFASSCRCSSMCMASWLCSVNSSPHSEQMRFSSFSWSIICALRLATRENFLLHTGQTGSSALCVHLWSVRLNSTLNVWGHWSHRCGYLR